jgi:hypothetical protein
MMYAVFIKISRAACNGSPEYCGASVDSIAAVVIPRSTNQSANASTPQVQAGTPGVALHLEPAGSPPTFRGPLGLSGRVAFDHRHILLGGRFLLPGLPRRGLLRSLGRTWRISPGFPAIA